MASFVPVLLLVASWFDVRNDGYAMKYTTEGLGRRRAYGITASNNNRQRINNLDTAPRSVA
jgi:hypothetical protein